jgi:hypothetical protein
MARKKNKDLVDLEWFDPKSKLTVEAYEQVVVMPLLEENQRLFLYVYRQNLATIIAGVLLLFGLSRAAFMGDWMPTDLGLPLLFIGGYYGIRFLVTEKLEALRLELFNRKLHAWVSARYSVDLDFDQNLATAFTRLDQEGTEDILPHWSSEFPADPVHVVAEDGKMYFEMEDHSGYFLGELDAKFEVHEAPLRTVRA